MGHPESEQFTPGTGVYTLSLGKLDNAPATSSAFGAPYLATPEASCELRHMDFADAATPTQRANSRRTLAAQPQVQVHATSIPAAACSSTALAPSPAIDTDLLLLSLEEENDRLRSSLAAERRARQRAEAAAAAEATRAHECERRAWVACTELAEARRRIAQLEEHARCHGRVEVWLRSAITHCEDDCGGEGSGIIGDAVAVVGSGANSKACGGSGGVGQACGDGSGGPATCDTIRAVGHQLQDAKAEELLLELNELERRRGGSRCSAGASCDATDSSQADADVHVPLISGCAADAPPCGPACVRTPEAWVRQSWRHTDGGATPCGAMHRFSVAPAAPVDCPGAPPRLERACTVGQLPSFAASPAWPDSTGAGGSAASQSRLQSLPLQMPVSSAPRAARPRQLGASLEAAAAWQPSPRLSSDASGGHRAIHHRLSTGHSVPTGLPPKAATGGLHTRTASCADRWPDAAFTTPVPVPAPSRGSHRVTMCGAVTPVGCMRGQGVARPAHVGACGELADWAGREAVGSPAGWCSIPLGSPVRGTR